MGLSKAGQPQGAVEIFDLVRDDLAKVEDEIRLESVASVDAITTIGRYLHSAGGKRLRPILVLLAAKLFGPVKPAAVRMAAVVEMIHAATLVHDDVIDYAETRRGRPSTNAVWGNHTSVLAGDWLYMQAFQIALGERNFTVLDLLLGLTQRMVEGELLQLDRIGKISVSEADYMELVDRKTASLFSACARLGTIFGGGRDEEIEKLGEYAWNLGMAFQLIDDVLDFTADENVLGKPVGSDLREGKVTLPLIYALHGASEGERGEVAAVLAEGHYDNVAFTRMLDLIRRHDGIERAMDRAQSFREKARLLIAEFPDSAAQRALASLTELVTDRDH
jgi:octaprenyl-diphosphate synthase